MAVEVTDRVQVWFATAAARATARSPVAFSKAPMSLQVEKKGGAAERVLCLERNASIFFNVVK